jgi:hypothetical protein
MCTCIANSMSQSIEFCHHNPLCCFSTSVYFCKCIFRYRLSTETFGNTLCEGKVVLTVMLKCPTDIQEWPLTRQYICLSFRYLQQIQRLGFTNKQQHTNKVSTEYDSVCTVISSARTWENGTWHHCQPCLPTYLRILLFKYQFLR